MLNSTEHEILNAHKYENVKKFSILQAQVSLECQQLLTVGILTFMSRKLGSTELSMKKAILPRGQNSVKSAENSKV